MDPIFKVAALGDSSGVGIGSHDSAGYPDRLAKWLVQQGFKVGLMNVAESGATATKVRARQVGAALRRPADLILLGVGTNDLWRMTPIESFGADLEAIGDKLASTGAPVLVANIIDLSLAPIGRMIESFLQIPRATFHERLAKMNARVAKMAADRRFELVDLHAVSVAELSSHPEYFGPDGFHGSAAGYERWSVALRPAALEAAEAWSRRRATA